MLELPMPSLPTPFEGYKATLPEDRNTLSHSFFSTFAQFGCSDSCTTEPMGNRCALEGANLYSPAIFLHMG